MARLATIDGAFRFAPHDTRPRRTGPPDATTATAAMASTVFVILVWLALAATSAWSAPAYPELTGRVVDGANLLSAYQRAQLETELAAFEAKSTDQIVVVTVPSLGGYPIDEYGYGLGRAWGIGQKGKDNGLIVIVAPNERKVRLEVGRRLEPLIPDGKAGEIIRSTIQPQFRRGDFGGGIIAGVNEIKAVLTSDAAELAERAKRPPPPVDYSGYIILAFWLLIVIFVIRAQMQQAAQIAAMTPEQRRRYEQLQRRRRAETGPIIILVDLAAAPAAGAAVPAATRAAADFPAAVAISAAAVHRGTGDGNTSKLAANGRHHTAITPALQNTGRHDPMSASSAR